MNKSALVLSQLKKQKLLPLFFHPEEVVSIAVLKTLYGAGIRLVEYTNRGKEAVANFKALILERDRSMPGLFIGAGTIRSAADATLFTGAGADFIVAPCILPEIGKIAGEKGLLWIPGCMTATEIALGAQHGAELIKIFPGNLLGPSYISAIREIFPELLFMPTGGVELTPENIGAWFRSGVTAVGLGSKLISKELLENKDYAKLAVLAKKALEIVQTLN